MPQVKRPDSQKVIRGSGLLAQVPQLVGEQELELVHHRAEFSAVADEAGIEAHSPHHRDEHLDQVIDVGVGAQLTAACLLYTSPSPRDVEESRMPSSA